ncbi:hypothetical protein SUGI_0070880 [Cryptomeria japonica]|uniref:F-box/kelch-repeat protein At1g55270 n=1 Tax=Cryptomeria japonica TaxID=3369 RepID=UPI002408B24E|nr:F-box/kelch-repeat protein At1g55270 [Cryptomeria japonica]GLJ07613.1 hypothetical protein SUGI_0070880 [Cryptomeria japonica]
MAMEIFPGLPDDIGRRCLLRVPRTSHYTLALVCKTWKNIVCSPLFYQDRKRTGLSQELIVLCWRDSQTDHNICRIKLYDPLQNSFETLPPFPYSSSFFNCVAFDHKLFFMGVRTSWPHSTIQKALVIYDFSSGLWKRGPDLPDCRYEFCRSLDSAKGLIYIAGGQDSDNKELRTAIVYDIEDEKWEYLPSLKSDYLPPLCWRNGSVCIDDKFYVVSHWEKYIQAYDPNTRQWSTISTSYDGSSQVCLAAFGRIYPILCRNIIRRGFLENQSSVACIGPPAIQLCLILGVTMWHQQILIVGANKEDVRVFYLFEPSIQAGEEDKWTLITTLSKTELPDEIAIIGTIAL